MAFVTIGARVAPGIAPAVAMCLQSGAPRAVSPATSAFTPEEVPPCAISPPS